MTTNNRYDRLNELEEVESETPLLTDEWIQAPDGSWVRSSDKVARKLAKKGKLKSAPTPAAKPARAPEPEAAPKEEPKRGLFGRRSAEKQRKAEIERERKAELERQAQQERERRAELQRQAELEREREAERERQAELERQRLADLEYEAELERERKAELARELELERERKAEEERERKLQAELERQAEVERKASQKRGRKAERERQAALEREAELERERLAELDRTARAETKSSPFFSESDRLLARWPEATSEYPADPEPWVSTTSWPDEDEYRYEDDDYEPKHEPKRHAPAAVRLSAGQRITQVAIAVGLVAATLLIGAAITWLSPDPDRSQRPFATSGKPGESLDIRTFTITVQTARAAAAIQSGQTAQDAQGTWVIVRVRLTANTEPTRIGYAALRDSAGNTYLASDRLTQPLLDGKRTLQPGIPIEGDVVFEVPKDALGGLTALFAARPEMVSLDAMASVELPALTVAADQPPATLAPTEVKP